MISENNVKLLLSRLAFWLTQSNGNFSVRSYRLMSNTSKINLEDICNVQVSFKLNMEVVTSDVVEEIDKYYPGLPTLLFNNGAGIFFMEGNLIFVHDFETLWNHQVSNMYQVFKGLNPDVIKYRELIDRFNGMKGVRILQLFNNEVRIITRQVPRSGFESVSMLKLFPSQILKKQSFSGLIPPSNLEQIKEWLQVSQFPEIEEKQDLKALAIQYQKIYTIFISELLLNKA